MSAPDDLLLLRNQLHLDEPEWLKHVLATGVGAKIADGRPTGEPALHLFVDDKLPLRALSASERIPASIDGFATDVVRASGEFSLKLFSGVAPAAPEVKTAIGLPLIADDEAGTIACAGRRDDGSEVLITCAHVAARGADANLVVPGQPPLGRCDKSVEFAKAGQFDGFDPEHAGLRACVDAAAIALESPVVFAGGQPGRVPFSVGETDELAAWLQKGGVQTRCFGADGVQYQGLVCSVWPRVVGTNWFGFCAIQPNPPTQDGDSGSLWLADRGAGGWVALGLHRGLPKEWPSGHAFVTDLRAAMSALGVTTLLTDPGETTKVSSDERVLAAPWLASYSRRLRLFR